MDGGEVKLATIQFPWHDIHYRYDCVWQLKPPRALGHKLHVYFRITTMNLEDGKCCTGTDKRSVVINWYNSIMSNPMKRNLASLVIFSSIPEIVCPSSSNPLPVIRNPRKIGGEGNILIRIFLGVH